MLYYVPQKIDKVLLRKLLSIALDLNGRKATIWHFPHTVVKASDKFMLDLGKYGLGMDNLEAPTLYEGDTMLYKKMECYMCHDKFMLVLLKNYSRFIQIFDSLAVYYEDSSDWFMSIIVHENMTLFKDISEDNIKLFNKHGVKYSDTPPKWW